ncbi:Holliday junction branch migration protein RuvA [Methylovirgula sp. HY1]|uniref:Holliday junction branch migration protein RuvA n=1 Tax=Methylovirgula sp. HY1 TaxID=2822761 RepID=UPI001C5BF8D8|nr:Holliday junction branch migration protein RuvA [Methylovirgula sp. HY1]QXX75643.1 Holliday junction ATP-dependent DNA helicase RuvA [Methylovirgula sp. HY1]
MIGKLKGLIDTVGEDFIILDVHGVGYLVHCSSRTLARLHHVGDPASLAIETHVREDAIRLYGFTTDAERDWFRLLQTVQGVGAKVALAILGTMSPEELAASIARQDKARIAQAQGIGPRLAARLVAELKDKAPPNLAFGKGETAMNGHAETQEPQAVQDAISALLTLGYGRPQAAGAAAAAQEALGGAADVAALIRHSLKLLAP